MTSSPAPTLDPPIAAEATLLGSMLLGYTTLEAAAALQSEFFTSPINADLFRAIRARLSSFPDEDSHDRITAAVKEVPAARGDLMVAILQLGRYRSVAPLVVPRIIDAFARRRQRTIAKVMKRELRASRLTGPEVLDLAQQQLADLRAALPAGAR